MSRFISRRPRPSALRTRTAVVAAGLGAVTVLGTGAAIAAETGTAASKPVAVNSTANAVAAQAQAQSQAAAKTVAAQKAAAAKKAAAKKAVAAKSVAVKKAASGWTKPVSQYVVSATYGNAGNMWASKHSGQDFAVPTGTVVNSVGPGTVVKAGPNGAGDGPAYGNAVVVKHDSNTYSQYAHLSRVDVKIGQQVQGGQQIALSGNTGNSSGPHLHFEIRTTPNYGSAINPVSYLRAQGVTL
ncbi:MULTISPECIES: M23 family metallopeptidase [unclassified Streptomyces]|uniref:M23 family metallopeptidase n=1 Tax=unclassified Streptomyces TaxID=2593676 RepID=UPI002E293988|nr:M23 family metallopeptidase [Streptomyces sp. NBC_00690]